MTDKQDARAAFTNFCLDRLNIHWDNIEGLIAEFFERGVHQGPIKYVSHTDTEITVTLMLGWGKQEETRTFTRRDKWPGSERFEVAVAFHRMAKKQADDEAKSARFEGESAIVQAVAESWAARQAAITDDLDTYTPEEPAFNGALKRLGIEATREEVRELSAAVFVVDGTPGGTFLHLSYADHDNRGCTLSARYDQSETAIRLDVPLAISSAQGKALLAKAQRDAKPPLPETSADSLFDDTQPGVPVDQGVNVVRPTTTDRIGPDLFNRILQDLGLSFTIEGDHAEAEISIGLLVYTGRINEFGEINMRVSAKHWPEMWAEFLYWGDWIPEENKSRHEKALTDLAYKIARRALWERAPKEYKDSYLPF